MKYETVEKTKDGLVPKVIEREGPTGLIITTTAHKLHPENETRMLSLTVTDTREQTAAVFQALADDSRDDIDFRKWHALPEESQIYAAEEEPLQHCAAKSGSPIMRASPPDARQISPHQHRSAKTMRSPTFLISCGLPAAVSSAAHQGNLARTCFKRLSLHPLPFGRIANAHRHAQPGCMGQTGAHLNFDVTGRQGERIGT